MKFDLKFLREHVWLRNMLSYDQNEISFIEIASFLNIQASLAHLTQRLIGELIGHSWAGVRLSLSVVVNNFKHLLLQNRLPDQSQILCGASVGRGAKVSLRHLCHMTKMADTPIYGKNPSKIFFSRTGRPIFTNLGIWHWGLQPIIVCSHDDP